MKITGIIAEYNPFHNGHAYHIRQALELTKPDLLIAVISGNYNQRGDVSIIDKFAKTEAALRHGVDLVVELPYIFTVQNAYVFGSKSVSILNRMHADHLVFGSETGNLEELKKYAQLQIDVTRLKQLMHEGNSYPHSYGLLAGSLYPNDMLAVTYLKAMTSTDIVPVAIKRTNDYLGKDMAPIASATAIRNALHNGLDISKACPITITEPVFNQDLYPYIRSALFSRSAKELQEIFLVSEGIENLLKENAIRYDDFDSFIEHSVSRRYTRSRIQRILLQIVCGIGKQEVAQLPDNDFIRVLGFNKKGREYLKCFKKELPFISQFKTMSEPYKQIEWRTSLIYSLLRKDPAAYLKKELKGPIISE